MYTRITVPHPLQMKYSPFTFKADAAVAALTASSNDTKFVYKLWENNVQQREPRATGTGGGVWIKYHRVKSISKVQEGIHNLQYRRKLNNFTARTKV